MEYFEQKAHGTSRYCIPLSSQELLVLWDLIIFLEMYISTQLHHLNIITFHHITIFHLTKLLTDISYNKICILSFYNTVSGRLSQLISTLQNTHVLFQTSKLYLWNNMGLYIQFFVGILQFSTILKYPRRIQCSRLVKVDSEVEKLDEYHIWPFWTYSVVKTYQKLVNITPIGKLQTIKHTN